MALSADTPEFPSTTMRPPQEIDWFIQRLLADGRCTLDRYDTERQLITADLAHSDAGVSKIEWDAWERWRATLKP